VNDNRHSGLLVPVLTPFGADLAPDHGRYVGLCKALLAEGAGGLAIFGTTSEANSTSPGERRAMLEALLAAGVPAARLMPGVGSTSITEAADNVSMCVRAGCGGVLMLPPFYYKGVSDDGIFAFFAEVIERAGKAGPPRIYLYHIPPQAVVGFGHDLIERLLDAFPGVILGIKDSSGDWDNMRAMMERFDSLDVFCGSEEFMLATLRHGGAGCITATGNVNVADISRLGRIWREDGADDLQAKMTAVRKAFSRKPPIPMMKRYIASRTGHEDWARVRPPLTGVGAGEVPALVADLETIGYAPGGLFEAIGAVVPA